MRNRTARAASLLAALTLAMGACAVPVPEFTPPPAETQVYPVLDESRLDRVLAAINDTIAEADAEASRSELSDRVTGRAARMRGWEYALAKATEEAELEDPYTPQPLGTHPAVTAVAATDEWPRQIMVITDPPEGGNVPLLLALEQETARDHYALTGWVRLMPGVTTPQMHAPASGSTQVEAEAEGFLLSPADTVAAYADIINDGEEADDYDLFAEDAYRGLLAEELEALTSSLRVAGRVTQETTRTGPTVALETFDGGAIVFGGLKTVHTYEKTVANARMMVGDWVSAMNDGESEVSTKLAAEYQQMIAFYVPAADSSEEITVLGAERVLRSVKEPEE